MIKISPDADVAAAGMLQFPMDANKHISDLLVAEVTALDLRPDAVVADCSHLEQEVMVVQLQRRPDLKERRALEIFV